LLSAASLAAGAQAALAALDPTAGATGATGAESATGVQTAKTCSNPRLTSLPKKEKFGNSTIHFKLVHMPLGAAYLIKVAQGEVLGGAATSTTVKNSFQLPDQGPKSHRVPITAIVSTDDCANSPWKMQKKISYKGYKVAATPAPTTPAPATPKPAATPKATPTPPAVATPKVKTPAIKLPKLPKPLPQRLPDPGPALSVRMWMTPVDNVSRIRQELPRPKLSRLERKSEKANSTNALAGLGIVFVIFTLSTAVGLMAFHRRDEIQFEAALSAQLKHLEEGDPGLTHGREEPSTAPFAVEMAGPGAEAIAADGEAPTEVPVPVEEPAVAEEPAAAAPAPEVPLTHHREEVEAELQRILNDAGLEAELHGILSEAKLEAERQGVAIDPDLMVNALCDELNGSANLSDPARAQLRSKFEQIIAEEAAQVPQQAS